MTRAQRERLAHLKREANHQKTELLRLADMIRELSPRQAEQLDSIIGRLEGWQHTGTRAG